MRSFLPKIEKLKIRWNEVPLTEEIFHKLCRRSKIKVTIMPLTVKGFYSCDKKKHYIAINEKLPPAQRLFTMWHEFAHFLMHSPSTDPVANYCGSKENRRFESEADAFAYCSVLPLEVMLTKPDEEVADIYGFSFFMERLSVYDRYAR